LSRIKIKIYTTGGSIDKTYSTRESDFIVAAPVITQVLNEANIDLDYEVVPICRKDSLEITDLDRRQLAQCISADPNRYILITHGTDTMVATAKALQAIPNKVIVLTGAMKPASFRESDAPFNAGCAIMALQTLPEGVHLVMNGRVFDPTKTKKNLEENRYEQS